MTAAPASFHAGVAYSLGDLAVRSPNYFSTYAGTGREIINVES